MYSSIFTPVEFGFFRGLPENLFVLDIIGQIAFLFDIVLQFCLAYRDSRTYCMIYKRAPIALRLAIFPLIFLCIIAHYYHLILVRFFFCLFSGTWDQVLSLICLVACLGTLFTRYKFSLSFFVWLIDWLCLLSPCVVLRICIFGCFWFSIWNFFFLS